ncbi:MAG TPA: phosphatase PAP2 family protein, partial [Acetobacteraceae bacterium]|nr:phosphatase PAP2 family protein [Acetobacteraceae bacterium]
WICLPRLYLGIHYPSDLVFGALLGVGTVWGVAQAMEMRGGAPGHWLMARIDAAERRAPQAFYAVGFLVSFEITMIFNDVRDLVRAVLHAMRALGFAAGEGVALFVTGGVLLLAAAALAVLRRSRSRRGGPRARGSRRINPRETPGLRAAALGHKERRFHPSR